MLSAARLAVLSLKVLDTCVHPNRVAVVTGQSQLLSSVWYAVIDVEQPVRNAALVDQRHAVF